MGFTNIILLWNCSFLSIFICWHITNCRICI